jgi:ankyrin repeat protein
MKGQFLLIVLAMVLFTGPGSAQVPPDEIEVQAYDGLLEAAYEGDTEAVREQLASGADVGVRDAKGRTPAHLAAYTSDEAVLDELAGAGADLDALEFQRYDIVTIAAVANDPGFLSMALDLGASPANTTSIYDGTALIAAAHLGHFQVVQILIDAGAPLDHVNNLGWTALMEAVVLGDGGPDHVRTVKALVDAGADRTITDRQGRTPLQHASERGYAEMVKLLQ